MEALSTAFSSLSQLPVARIRKQYQQRTSFLSQKVKQRAMPRLTIGPNTRLTAQPLDMAISSGGRDISVMLPVSGLLIFMYWFSNFLVPQLIMKNLQKDENDDKGENS